MRAFACGHARPSHGPLQCAVRPAHSLRPFTAAPPAPSTTQYRCQRIVLTHADAAASFGGAADEGLPEEIKILPRLREKDPHRVLGIPKDADFEEVQEARNYLIQEFRAHEASREHIELAYESIVSNSFKNRRKQGFRPGRTNKRKQEVFVAPLTLKEKLKAAIDPSATLVTLVNEAVVYGIIGFWSAMVIPQNTLPTMLTFAYATYKMMSKRNMRTPEGPFFGGSAVWGAVLVGVVGMFVSLVLASGLQMYFPWWRFNINDMRAMAFLTSMLVCPITVFLK